MKRVFVRYLSLALAAIMAMGTVLAGCGKDEMVATTMRLLKTEGVVKLEVDGEKVDFTENQRLSDGNALITEAASMAAVGLDDYKTVTMDELSRAEFYKDGKNIQLVVTEGNAFFRVDKALEADETMYVGQPNMMVGIRGTAGTIGVDAAGRPCVYLVEGSIEVEAINPDTGEKKKIQVKAPVKLAVHYYNDREIGHTVEFSAIEITPDQMDAFTAEQVVKDEDFMKQVASYTGWSVQDLENVSERLDSGLYEPLETDAVKLGIVDPDDASKKEGDTEEELDKGEVKTEDPDNLDETVETEITVEEPLILVPEEPEIVDYAERGRNDATIRAAIVAIDSDGKIYLSDGTIFDWKYYAANNPDVVAAYGYDPYALLYHYMYEGKNENDRYPSLEQEHQVAAKKQEEQRAAEQFQKEQEEAGKGGGEDEGGDGGSTPQMYTWTVLREDGVVITSGSAAAGAPVSFTISYDYQPPTCMSDIEVHINEGNGGYETSFTMPAENVTFNAF